MMGAVWFTIVAIVLYLFSDWLLERAEVYFGRRFEHRSLVFFVILLALALLTFSVIQQTVGTA